MAEARVERRLAAILAADIAGYSRLMGADEEGTLSSLKAHRRMLSDPKIEEHHGRIFKTTGDGMLVEFPSVVDAVKCAVAIQRGMAVRNAEVSPDKRIEFRMGINIGDVIEDDGDVFGDGVNVAARLQGISARGGICVSRHVLDLIEGKVDIACRELGRQNLKNIARPIEVYGIDLHDEGSLAARILADAELKQQVQYCNAADGVRLAFAKVGSGPPLMRTGHWLSHLEYDWELPISVTACLRSLNRSRLFVTMPAATVCQTGMSARFPLMRGSATWRRLSMPPVSLGFRCSDSRKAAPCRSPTR